MFIKTLLHFSRLEDKFDLHFVEFRVPEKMRLTLLAGNYIYNRQLHLFQNISLVITRTGTPQRKFVSF